MIYYFGWIVLSLDSENDDDFSEVQHRQMLNDVDALTAPIKQYQMLCERRAQNYLDVLFISSAQNHNIGYKEDVLSLFEQVGKLASGSYGLLYMREPEDSVFFNEFCAYRLAKGILTQQKDNLLSPCDLVMESNLH